MYPGPSRWLLWPKKPWTQYGAVHLLCNNAGVSYNSRSSWETPLAGWEWVLGVNLMGVVHGIHAFLPLMLEQADEAHIVNTASTSGLVMNSYAVPYGVSKHAVVALSESLHLELESRKANVGVSVLCPGPVDTEIVDASCRNLPGKIPPDPTFRMKRAPGRSLPALSRPGPQPGRGGSAGCCPAVKEKRFYIFTHDYHAAIETRMNNLLEEEKPQPSPPNPKLVAILESMHRQIVGVVSTTARPFITKSRKRENTKGHASMG